MLESIVSTVGAAASGGMLGTAGGLANKTLGYFSDKQKHQYEMTLREQDRKDMELESKLHIDRLSAETAGKIKTATIEGEVAAEIEASKLVQVSYSHDKTAYNDGFVDTVRGLTRPTLTLALVGISSWMLVDMMSIPELVKSDAAQARAIFAKVVNDLLFLTTLAVSWWFGGRAHK